MAETDAFIFAALQQSGWLDAAQETSSWTVAELSSDELIAVVLKFLGRQQDADDGATFTLPSVDARAPVGVAARHRVGSKLANILKELGYAGDCGYNHFLYPSEKETRNILSWLVGKLSRSKLEENDEDDSKSEVLARMGAGTDAAGWQDSVLKSEQLGNIFSSWKREKMLHVLPNPDLKGLKGFQQLPLQTSTLELPWTRPGKSTCKLFDNFPSDSVKSTSLLEALAVAKRGSTVVLREEEFEEEVEMEVLGVALKRDEIKAALKSTESAEETGFLAPQEAETEDDKFAAIQPQSFLVSALPDVPLTLNPSDAALGAEVAVGEGSSKASTGSSAVDSSKAEGGIVGQQFTDEQSLEEVQKQLDDTERRIAAMRKVLDRERGELQQVQQHVLETQATGQEMQKQLARQKQLVAMLPQAQANIAKLEAISQTNEEKKVELVQQMEIARGPLLKEYAELEGQKSSRKARCRQLIREIKAFRTEMQEITGIIHSKMESMRALEKIQERQITKLGKKKDSEGGPMTRNMYTSRIMDIIKQVHKQKQDIAKILEDIKGLQKQLNAASEKLKRTEAVAEEKLYSAASKSKISSSTKAEAYVECYRKFAQVRELFEELIVVIGDVGKKENAARDLQNWISQLEARDSSSHLDKVLADLESVRLENGTLQHELRARVGYDFSTLFDKPDLHLDHPPCTRSCGRFPARTVGNESLFSSLLKRHESCTVTAVSKTPWQLRATMGSERRLERKLRRKEEKKGLVGGTEVSSKVEVAPGELEEESTAPVDETPAFSDPAELDDPGKAQRVMPIGELPSRQKPKTSKSPRKKKKKPEEELEAEPVEFRVNGILVDRDVKGGAKKNWMGVYMVLFRTSTPLGQRMAFILIGLVTISVTVAVMDSVKEIRDQIGDYLLAIEFGFTILFTIEFGLRVACLRKPSKFIFSLLGFVDMCALVPSYVGYIFPEARPLLHLAVLRVFRVMRVFRLMRLARFVDASAALTENIETNRRNIAVFLVALFTVILVIGSAMYLIEGDRQFGNIPVSLYWTVVTITTVGYGDISPQTIVGRILATIVMFVGYGIIASPTLLSAPPAAPVTSEILDCPKCTKVLECTRCFQKFHQESANFCCMCAEPLRKPELKALRANGEERKRTPRSRASITAENGFPKTPESTENPSEIDMKPAIPVCVPSEEVNPAEPTTMIC